MIPEPGFRPQHPCFCGNRASARNEGRVSLNWYTGNMESLDNYALGLVMEAHHRGATRLVLASETQTGAVIEVLAPNGGPRLARYRITQAQLAPIRHLLGGDPPKAPIAVRLAT